MIKRIGWVIALFAICLAFFTACSKTPVELFDEVISNIEKQGSMGSRDDEDFKDLWEETEEKLKELGVISGNADAQKLDQTFVDSYLETHTKEEFLSNVLKLHIFLRDERNYSHSFYDVRDPDWHDYEIVGCECQSLNALLRLAFEINGVETNGLNESMKDTEGYYTGHPDAEPLPFEETHSTSVFDEHNVQMREETMTDTGIVEYYGDYAIQIITRYNYNQGFLGWVDGTYIDKPGGWEKIEFCKLFYKGQYIADYDTKEEIFLGGICIAEIDGTIYLVEQVSLQKLDVHDKVVSTHNFLDVAEFVLQNNEEDSVS